MKNILLSILLVLISLTGYSTIWTIENEGFIFVPDTVIIAIGDTVVFSIGDIHNAVEVSEETWNANGNDPLPGFSVPFGGGTVLPADLAEGTHYYVCQPHASGGMKGVIIVRNTVGVPDGTSLPDLAVFPNPSNGNFALEIGEQSLTDEFILEVYDVTGKRVYKTAFESSKINLSLASLNEGVYFIRLYLGQSILTKRIVIQ